jgi:hypothetical protein
MSTSVPTSPLAGGWPIMMSHRSSDSLTTVYSGVKVGWVSYLCLKNTVCPTCTRLVSTIHWLCRIFSQYTSRSDMLEKCWQLCH